MELPLVTAVMVTGKDPVRQPLAEAAIRSFFLQDYPHKRLVIVTDGFSLMGHICKTYDEADRQLITELKAPKQTLGGLRNVALDYCDSPFYIQWDDDDWSGPTRISDQLKTCLDGALLGNRTPQPVTLRYQVRYSFETNSAYIYTGGLPGIHGTVLHPKTDFRYETIGKHEDSHFLNLFEKVGVFRNPPELYLRFHHGANTWSQSHIMRQYSGQADKWELPPDASVYLKSVLAEHYTK